MEVILGPLGAFFLSLLAYLTISRYRSGKSMKDWILRIIPYSLICLFFIASFVSTFGLKSLFWIIVFVAAVTIAGSLLGDMK
ncbi:MAG: hypothetical protein K0R50_1377 [Eubacterium sp.]|jgi:hypothetical protein|nr:hypothetical protein [Eubacterium sp.]